MNVLRWESLEHSPATQSTEKAVFRELVKEPSRETQAALSETLDFSLQNREEKWKPPALGDFAWSCAVVMGTSNRSQTAWVQVPVP